MNKLFWKAFLWNRFWALFGVFYLLVLGPYFLKFDPGERAALLRVGGIAAIILILLFSYIYSRASLPLRKFFSEGAEKRKPTRDVIKTAFQIPERFFVSSVFAFGVGTAAVIYSLYVTGLLSGTRAILAFLWGIGTGLGVGWVSSVGTDFFLHDLYRAFKVKNTAEIPEKKNLHSMFVFWFTPMVFFAVYYTGIVAFASATYSFDRSVEHLVRTGTVQVAYMDGGEGVGFPVKNIALVKRKFASSLSTSVFLFGFTILVLSVIVPAVAVNKMRRTIQELDRGLEGFSRGDLSGDLNVTSFDELGYLSASFNDMVASMRQLVSRIKEAGNVITSSANQIHSAVEEQTALVAENNSAVAEITSAIQELNQSAAEMVEMANSLSEIVENFHSAAQEGGKNILEVLKRIDDLAAEIESISARMLELDKKASRVDEVIKIIGSIADETHILSINAAIEAAAAGEHGRRFSVVASEVRRLADESRKATESIFSVLSEIKKGVGEALKATEKSVKDAHEAQRKANMAGEGIKMIQEESTKARDYTKRIVLTINQSKTALEQVSLSMGEISQASERSTLSMKEIEEAIGSLLEVIRELKELANKFRVKDEEG